MRVTQHSSNNGVLGAPLEVDHERCGAAPITRLEYGDGTRTVRTHWTPTAQELEILNAGGTVTVEVWGLTMAPTIVGAAPKDGA